MQSASGYDIAFRAADGTTVLDWEIEYYDAANGRPHGLGAPPRDRGSARHAGPERREHRLLHLLRRPHDRLLPDPPGLGVGRELPLRLPLPRVAPATRSPPAPVDATKNGVGSRINPQGDGALVDHWGDMGSPIYAGAWDLTTPPTTPPATFGLDHRHLPVRQGRDPGREPALHDRGLVPDGRRQCGNYVGIVTKGRDGGFNDWVGLWVTDNGTTPPNALALGNFTGGRRDRHDHAGRRPLVLRRRHLHAG